MFFFLLVVEKKVLVKVKVSGVKINLGWFIKVVKGGSRGGGGFAKVSSIRGFFNSFVMFGDD